MTYLERLHRRGEQWKAERVLKGSGVTLSDILAIGIGDFMLTIVMCRNDRPADFHIHTYPPPPT